MLKVIGAGFGRTGTLSMKLALEQLGFDKCHHMIEVFPSRKQVDAWHAISQGWTPDWDDVFEGYQACVDFPGSAVYRDLIDAFPEAKVILTVRDAASWYDSAAKTIYPASTRIPNWLTVIVPRARKIKEMSAALIWDKALKGQFENRAEAERIFDAHVEEVKRTVPADRLLVMHVKEGWEPICRFLDVPVPSTQFPNVNDSEEFQSRIGVLNMLRSVPLVAGGIAVIAAGLMLWQAVSGAG